MNDFTIIFIIALLISNSIQFYLAYRHGKFVDQHKNAVPDAFKDKVPLAAHQKAAAYTQAKLSLGKIDEVIGIAILLGITLGGGINWAFC